MQYVIIGSNISETSDIERIEEETTNQKTFGGEKDIFLEQWKSSEGWTQLNEAIFCQLKFDWSRPFLATS